MQGGFEATAKIREWERENGIPSTAIIALTAHAMVGDREKCLAAQMDVSGSNFISHSFVLTIAGLPLETSSSKPTHPNHPPLRNNGWGSLRCLALKRQPTTHPRSTHLTQRNSLQTSPTRSSRLHGARAGCRRESKAARSRPDRRLCPRGTVKVLV